MSARSQAWVKVRKTEYLWVPVQAVTLDDAIQELRDNGYNPEIAQWDPPSGIYEIVE